MNWIPLTDLNQLETIKDLSFSTPQVILKHSTTCSISKMALARMERSEAPDSIQFYYLDLLNYRPISNAIAEKFNVYHECTYDESHGGIQMEEIVEQAAR